MRFQALTVLVCLLSFSSHAKGFYEVWQELDPSKKQFTPYVLEVNNPQDINSAVTHFIENTLAMLEKISGKDQFSEKRLEPIIHSKKQEVEEGLREGHTHLLAIKTDSGEMTLSVFLKELEDNENKVWFLTGFRTDKDFLAKLIAEQKQPKKIMGFLAQVLISKIIETAQIASVETLLTTDLKQNSPIGLAPSLGFVENDSLRSLIGYTEEPYKSNITIYSMHVSPKDTGTAEDDGWDFGAD